MRHEVNRAVRRGAVAALASALWMAPTSLEAQSWNLNQQAVDACERELTLRLGTEARARDPQAAIDSRSVTFNQQRNTLLIRGNGGFRRDRFDSMRNFGFDCKVDIRNGNTDVTYRWINNGWDDANDQPGWTQPPAYRPPPGSGWGAGNSNSYPQTGRVFFSGGIFNRASGKGLDVKDRSTENGANIQQWDFAQAPNQTWRVIDQGNGLFSIINQGSSKALDVQDHSAKDGGNVQQFNFANGDNQLWRLQRVAGYYQIVSVSSGKCLDVDAGRINENGANVQQWSCSGQPNQQWRLGS